MTYVTSIVAVGFYFERWRALATSLAVCGTSMGIVVFPSITQVLLSSLSWRLKFRCLAGIIFCVTFLGCLYRPLKPSRIVSVEEKKVVFNIGNRPSEESVEQKEGLLRGLFSKLHNMQFPTTADLYGKSTITLAIPRDLSSSSILSVASTSTTGTFKSLTAVKSKLSKLSEPGMMERLGTLYEEEELPDNSCKRWWIKQKYKLKKCCCRRNPIFSSARPMYRDDIFFGGSLTTLPAYSKSIVSAPTTDLRVTEMAELIIRYKIK